MRDLWLLERKFGEGLIEGHQVRWGLRPRHQVGGKFILNSIAAMLESILPPSVFHQDSAHRFGGCCEKVSSPTPFRRSFVFGQTHVRFVNECRGLKSLTGFLQGQPLCGQATQLIVNQGKDLTGSVRIALFRGVQ